MIVPCKFFGLEEKIIEIPVEPRLLVVFEGYIGESYKAVGKGHGRYWRVCEWDGAWYKYRGRMFDDEFNMWINAKGIGWADITVAKIPAIVDPNPAPANYQILFSCIMSSVKSILKT